MFKKKTVKRLYRKAPTKLMLFQAKRLQKFAGLSLLLSLLFAALSNPFAAYEQLLSLPSAAQTLPVKAKLWPDQVKELLASVPEFLRVFPEEAEKNTFAAFDFAKAQLDGAWPVFAKESKPADKEAGQSAVITLKPEIDYASLPFFIEIPKLNVYEVVKANVNPNLASEYQVALEDGVAHAKGSAFPGQEKLVYIFGHSTDGAWNVEAYNAVFYQIKDLVVGDEIILHLGEEQFVYVVSEQTILKGSDVDFINNMQNDNLLLLQTCWPPGTSWQRLFVSAVPATASHNVDKQ